ncbi:MAG: alpha/beta hydrolase [Balneolaceae bacterium]|nr:alpha/beta hydrolase [Balneolaceae bacterium]
MEGTADLFAYHGWGFDRHCWDSWQECIYPWINLKRFDRGYFGPSERVELNPEAYGANVVMAHSYGLHLCPSGAIEQADLLVIFGGFLRFHPEAAQYKRRSRLVLRQMIQQLRDEPRAVLRKFWTNAYHPDPAPDRRPEKIDKTVLFNDLKALNESALDPDTLKKAGKICILHGSEDGIVLPANGRELFNRLGEQSTYFEVKDAGHALPFTHTEECWKFLKPELRALMNR